MTMLDDATKSQVRAADPRRSTWLSANAGSGKTRVLTDRVARLLLGGADPRRILCLTYTKAAAGEMQNRLFQRLGEWAMLGDTALREQLAGLGVEEVGDLRAARTLFASAIETPGGLKIQTIHSFCASLLRRYPLEAGVSPRFAEMDETADRQLMAEVVEELADGRDVGAVDAVAQYHSGEEFEKLIAQVVRHSAALRDTPDQAAIWQACGLPPGTASGDIAARVFVGGEEGLLEQLVTALRAGKASDIAAAEKIGAAVGPGLNFDSLAALESVFLYGPDAKRPHGAKWDRFPTKDVRDALPFLPDLVAFMDRIEAARPLRVGLAAAERSRALHRFAAAFLPLYEERKRDRGWLSFDDLISRTRGLLSNPGVAEWVLFRLDGGIDHILVDEAQDTSPEQWEVIELLAREFISGLGARQDRHRTLFVVGDKKQSIYSFQGADADSFDAMRDHFEGRLRGHSPLARHELSFSFRSSCAVLNAVDQTFPDDGGGGVRIDGRHLAYREDLPGRVDLWPIVPPAGKADEDRWETPVDRVSPSHHVLTLAANIADTIRDMIDRGTTIPDKTGQFRRLGPGDILILVQRRRGKPSLFEEIISALKARRLPVAGADRLKLRDSLAVKDVCVLLSFLALPEDSLSLAASLRSPLFGWSEKDLYRLSAGRPSRYLWEELRRRKDEFAETFDVLEDLRNAADFLRPYDLIERMLIRHDGRNRLVHRLGPEAEDGIDELLNLALSYESTDIPSLTGFLSFLEAEDTEIKRQLESAGGRIRVMTVHGSKGLEAPLVILPDSTRKPPAFRDHFLVTGNGLALWPLSAAESPDAVNAARQARLDAELRERDRLLYVAMTRAQTWLIVCGSGEMPPHCWYGKVAAAMQGLPTQDIDTPAGPGLRFSHGTWIDHAPETTPDGRAAPQVPDWLSAPTPPPVVPPKALSPSDLGGAKALPGDPSAHDEEASLRKGRQIHLILEHLPSYPRNRWRDTVRALLSHGEDAAPEPVADRLLDEVAPILTDPALAPYFDPGSLAEVALTASLPELGGRRIHGTIDRLVVTPDRVLAIDFKTNAVVPDNPGQTPDGLLRQMGAYASALAQIYPDHRIETAILWTANATLMPLPHDIVMDALRSAATS